MDPRNYADEAPLPGQRRIHDQDNDRRIPSHDEPVKQTKKRGRAATTATKNKRPTKQQLLEQEMAELKCMLRGLASSAAPASTAPAAVQVIPHQHRPQHQNNHHQIDFGAAPQPHSQQPPPPSAQAFQNWQEPPPSAQGQFSTYMQQGPLATARLQQPPVLPSNGRAAVPQAGDLRPLLPRPQGPPGPRFPTPSAPAGRMDGRSNIWPVLQPSQQSGVHQTHQEHWLGAQIGSHGQNHPQNHPQTPQNPSLQYYFPPR